MMCKVCLLHWNESIVCCTSGRGFIGCTLDLLTTAVNWKFVECMMDLLSVPEHVIKKGGPHDHRHGKLPGNKEYHLVNNLEEMKRDHEGTDSCEIISSVGEKTIEMKKFVVHGTFLQMKITPIICQKNTFSTRTIGGSLSISRPLNILISNKRCPH